MKPKRINTILAAMFAIVLFAGLAKPSRADGGSITLSSVSGDAGTEVTVYGTISNTGGGTLLLNGESFTLGSASLQNGDVTDFFLNAPLSLAPDSNSGLIALFQFMIAPGTPGGVYSGNFLDILGGTGASDQNIIATGTFSVDVQSTSVPEPSEMLTLLAGLSALALWLARRP